MLVLESLPLAHPSLGWQANYVFFVRMFIGMVAIASCIAFECREFIPETQLTWKQVAVVGICQAVAYVAMLVGLAVATGVFPVPFSLALGFAPAMGVGFCVQYLLTRSQIPLIPDFAVRYRRLLAILTVGALPVLVYPVYATLFMQLSSRDQVAFSLLLPVIKYALRSLLLWKLHAHADIAGAVSSSGHLFHVLFTLTCLQNSKTFTTVGFFVAWNVANAVVSCLKTVYFARRNWELQRATVALESHHCHGQHTRPDDERHENMAKRALVLVEHTRVLSVLFREDPSMLVSPYHRYSSPKWIAKHQELLLKQHSGRQRAPVRRANNKQSLAPLGGSQRARRVNSAIKLFLDAGPAQVLLSSHRLAIAPKVSSFSAASPVEIQDTLAILHANELCLLNSYISGMVYMLYGASLVSIVC